MPGGHGITTGHRIPHVLSITASPVSMGRSLRHGIGMRGNHACTRYHHGSCTRHHDRLHSQLLPLASSSAADHSTVGIVLPRLLAPSLLAWLALLQHADHQLPRIYMRRPDDISQLHAAAGPLWGITGTSSTTRTGTVGDDGEANPTPRYPRPIDPSSCRSSALDSCTSTSLTRWRWKAARLHRGAPWCTPPASRSLRTQMRSSCSTTTTCVRRGRWGRRGGACTPRLHPRSHPAAGTTSRTPC